MDNPHNTQELGIGWLYVVTHANAQGLVKIGITDRPERRMEELDNPTVLARVPVRRPARHEKRLHQKYQAKRVPQTEWFALAEDELAELFEHLEELARPFLALIVLPGNAEPEPELEPEPEPEPEPGPPVHVQQQQWRSARAGGRIEQLQRKLGIEPWRAEMLRDHGLD